MNENIAERLAEPFEPREVKWKPQSVKGNRALAIGYIDCRVVQDRLDEVLGVENWADAYDIVPDGSVVCRLSLKIGGEWITKTDVGSPSEQPDGGDRLKAAFSDALKRAAVKFGVGRYLYRLPSVWADYDPQKRQFVRVPDLPRWALPKGPAVPPPPPPPAAPPAVPDPTLLARLRVKDEKLAASGLCQPGQLLEAVTAAGLRAGYAADIAQWPAAATKFVAGVVQEFEADCRQKPALAQ